jgi:two-component sensor histidine kinase
LKKQSQIQKVGLEKKSAIANLMIFSLALALVLLGVLFNRYKLNRRNNLVMQETQKEITAKNSWLEKLLQEKDWLLREVHHRVKNNLQIVMSLLQSQSVYLKDEVALIAIVESQHRVQAMSLIHQKLYKSGNLSTVYMPEYIYDLVEYLQDCFKTKNAVYFELKIEQIKLDVTKAVPVGLILNEIITNALKHAFPHTLDDKILVELYSSANDIISLVITDNGCGFPCDFDVDISKSFGMILMKGLTEDLDGTFTISSQSGIKTTITFSNLPLYFDKIGHVNPGES